MAKQSKPDPNDRFAQVVVSAGVECPGGRYMIIQVQGDDCDGNVALSPANWEWLKRYFQDQG